MTGGSILLSLTAPVSDRSVVVAVRGTATMEDVITDSVAAPDLLDRSEWLPESFKQQQAQTGRYN